MPDSNGNPLIGDLIAADVDATSDQSTKAAAAAAADSALSAANTAKSSADQALAHGLGKTGPTFTLDPNGIPTLWMPDSTATGFHTLIPKPATTPVPPDAPAPPPPPAPAPGN